MRVWCRECTAVLMYYFYTIVRIQCAIDIYCVCFNSDTHTCFALARESMLIDILLVLRVVFSNTDRHSHE